MTTITMTMMTVCSATTTARKAGQVNEQGEGLWVHQSRAFAGAA